MAFASLFDEIESKPKKAKPQLVQIERKPRKQARKDRPRGCEVCPMNKVKGVKKIFGKVTGKAYAIFAQSPGMDENEDGIELVGRAGQWLWEELGKVGLKRSQFDIQNVMRCVPADLEESSYSSYLKMRNPTNEELHCCSIHTDNILPKLKARQILVLGQLAAKALLQTRSLPAHKVFYDERLKAKIYLLDHPAFFIRGYASAQRLQSFRDTLKLFVEDASKESSTLNDPFAFIKAQDYRLVVNRKQAIRAAKLIRKYSRTRVVACDIEDIPWKDGRKVVACGFSYKPGLSFVFVFWHKAQHTYDGIEVQKIAKKLLEDVSIRKAFHYGCSDCTKLRLYADIRVARYEHDTLQSEYLRFVDAKKYGLDAIGERRFPEFSGYAMVIVRDIIKHNPDLPNRIKNASMSVQYNYIYKHGLFDISKLSLNTLRLYNGADCHLTKLIELDNHPKVSKPLMKMYIDLSFVLQDMEPNGPLFDFKQNRVLYKIYPRRAAKLLSEMRKMIKDPKFNPGSSQQVHKAIYQTLKLEYPFSRRKAGKPNTQKKTMLTLGREHPFPLLVMQWRRISKAQGTYIKGYRRCAKLNNKRLRTRWWSTGTRTGRLSSGGKRDDPGVVNLQNIHNDLQLKNMCIADRRWRRVYIAIKNIVEATGVTEKTTDKVKLQRIYWLINKWIIDNIPDLDTFLALDYGQIEVRVAALISGDKNLKRDCQESDIHTRVGVVMTGWPAEKIAHDKKTRTVTKNVHFGILFGIGVDNLYDFIVAMTDPNEQETISKEMVERAYHRYFKRYPGIKRFIDRQRAFAEQYGYVETLFGMKRILSIRDTKNDQDYDDDYFETEKAGNTWWGNIALNTPVQGSAHQFMINGLVNVRRQSKKYKAVKRICMDIHDSLVTFVRVLNIQNAYKKMRYLMEHEAINTIKKEFPKIKWDVPVITEGEAGLRLGCMVDLHENITPGEFMLNWFWKCQKQVRELNSEIKSLGKIVKKAA